MCVCVLLCMCGSVATINRVRVAMWMYPDLSFVMGVCVCYVFECVCTNVYCGCCSCVHMIFVVTLKERVCIKIIYLYRLMIKLYVTFNRKLHVSKCLFVCVWVRQHLEQRISDECICVYTLIIRMLSALCYAPQIAHKQSITNNKMSA